jgi:O-antigen/teichoic acid export membrane protein
MNMKHNSLTEGPIFKALVAFSLPMIITNTISLLFHAADVAVLALFVDGPAVAAVGACGGTLQQGSGLYLGVEQFNALHLHICGSLASLAP